MHVLEFESLFERVASRVVSGHFPLDWKEDSISHQLLRELRYRFVCTQLEGSRSAVVLEWEIYKLHGTRETNHGDIGVLVRHALPNGSTLEGAGFLEAKVRARNSTKFHNVRHQQVHRLLQRSPQTRLLLYDYNPVAVLSDDRMRFRSWDYGEEWYPHGHAGLALSQAVVLPLQLAASVNVYDDTLYRFAHGISYQFARRYFHMHDLDFSQAAIDAVKGFPADLGSPNVVLVVRIAPAGQELPDPPVFNDNVYGVFE